MLARPFRYLAPALAALGLLAPWLASPFAGRAAPSTRAEDGRVVFRHYV